MKKGLVFICMILSFMFIMPADAGWDEGSSAEEVKKLLTTGLDAGDAFGYSVAISGNQAIIGARKDNIDGVIAAGAGCIVKRTGENAWAAVTKITASDKEEMDSFGASIAIGKDRALVIARNKNVDGRMV